MSNKLTRVRIHINGRVQGVGFRPTVYRYAKEYNLSGWVSNTSQGVTIEIEGPYKNIENFINTLKTSPPPQAEITEIEVSSIPLKHEKEFRILSSITSTHPDTLISPDIATCEGCLKELFDPQDRRFLYPFLNCTNCGPRFTIVKSIPYDRQNTTMASFKMCHLCCKEYEDPPNRRFHAQPNACWECGPQIELWEFIDTGTKKMSKGKQVMEEVQHLLANGKIIAIKGLGGFHLACNALDEVAVSTLRKRKIREDKPFALMAKDLEVIKEFCSISSEEERLLTSPKRPIVILKKLQECRIAPSVAPHNNYLGFMLPYTPLHHLLFYPLSSKSQVIPVLVMTSGNLSDEPIAYKDDEAISKLSIIADYILLHNRQIHTRCDDSVTRVFSITKTEYIIRRSRGYVPQPIILPYTFKEEILACGAHLKNTFALAKDNKVFISHHIGDLENLESLQAFENGIRHFKDIFRITPKAIAYDLHPEYLSTKYALEGKEKLGLQTIGIQHHHAHIVSCMADNKLEDQKVIGVAFDGTGCGEDGHIWGGEFMIADFCSYQRKAYLKYIPLPGGEYAIKEPWRIAIAYLYSTFGKEYHKLDLEFMKRLNYKNILLIEKMILGKINSPLTSSMGRLFDAVSSLLGLRTHINYDGQAAIELEMITENTNRNYNYYTYNIDKYLEHYIIDPTPTIRGIVEDLQHSIAVPTISAKFHYTIAKIIVDACKLLSTETGLDKVVLSGGVFQNMFLLKETYTSLTKEGFKVYIHQSIPTNDGGISLGQIIIANSRLGR